MTDRRADLAALAEQSARADGSFHGSLAHAPNTVTFEVDQRQQAVHLALGDGEVLAVYDGATPDAFKGLRPIQRRVLKARLLAIAEML